MENSKEITCPQCGQILPDDSVYCVNCGAKVEHAFGDAGQMSSYGAQTKQKSTKKIIGTAVCICIVIGAIFMAVNAVQASKLKKELKRDWMDITGEDGVYLIKILDFSDDEVEYRIETGYLWMDTTLGTYDYKVVSGNKVKINQFGDSYKTYKIEFNEEKSMMTITSALTSTDAREYWFNLD